MSPGLPAEVVDEVARPPRAAAPAPPPRPGFRGTRPVLSLVFAVTGFSALTLQVVWQRVISMHGGVDLFSTTTVVAAFLGGLGMGSLLGGVVADRLGPRRSLLAFAASNAGIAAFAAASIWLFYDLYRQIVPTVGGLGGSFAFHVALLVVPTTLMGLSLPLISRGLVHAVDEIAPLVGRLYALNTLGAAAGAAVSGWWMLGTFGFTGTVRIAAALNLVAAALIFTFWRAASREPAPPAVARRLPAPPPAGRVWPWMVLYGLTGAVALGLEMVFFRVVGAVMRSNSYTFGHVLSLYLVLFGVGAAAGSRLVRRAARPERWFLWLQFAAGVGALGGTLLLLVPLKLPAFLGIRPFMEEYFGGKGFVNGGYSFASGKPLAQLLFANLIAPLLVMGAPVLCLGASFPFIQAVVSRRLDTLGRRTGTLLFSNIAGNVAGTLVVGFVLLDRLGTSGTLRLLGGLLVAPGLAAAALAPSRWRIPLVALAVVLVGLPALQFPSNRLFWAFLHSAPLEHVMLEEERSCVTTFVDRAGEKILYINATPQNGYPYDDFHVLIGLAPALMHPSPDRALAVGLGAGGTTYGMARDPRVDHVETVEICGGELELLEALAERGSGESAALLSDPRVELVVGDGRKALLDADPGLDIVTVDTLRPQSGYSGNLYSMEFYELVESRLSDDGLFVQWAATARNVTSARQVFPHVATFVVAPFNCSQFLVASRRPIPFDREGVLERFRAIDPQRAFSPALASSLERFFAGVEPVPVPAPAEVAEEELNRDLFPRDEYFLNNPLTRYARPPC